MSSRKIKITIIFILMGLFIPISLNWFKFCITKYYDADNASDSNFEYYIISDSEAMIGSYNKYGPTDLRIKDKVLIDFKIYNVTEIGYQAFKDLKWIKKVTLEKGIKRISSRAFYECENLSNVVVKGSLETIGNYAFYECENLSNVNIKGDVTTIGDNAFYGCKKLTFTQIPMGVCNIGDYAFAFCNSLERISIPSSVNHIGKNPFVGCSKLLNISVDENNRYYKSVNGILYDKRMNKLKCVPCKYNVADFIIPKSVKIIETKAFAYCTNNNLIFSIPYHINRIEENAFLNCKYRIKIQPSSQELYIGNGAFENCTTVDFILDEENGEKM